MTKTKKTLVVERSRNPDKKPWWLSEVETQPQYLKLIPNFSEKPGFWRVAVQIECKILNPKSTLSAIIKTTQQLGLWLRWIEQAPPEESGTLVGNSGSECGQTQGSLSRTTDKVILSQALLIPKCWWRRCRDWL
jgi:hypothetical protein